MLINPFGYIAVVCVALGVMLYLCVRNEGWRPAFRYLRIRRFVLVTLFFWGLAVLASPLYAAVDFK